MITPNIRRGLIVRRALLAIVRLSHARGLPLPTHKAIGHVIGISDCQVSRHLGRLMDDGAFTTRGRGRRVCIEDIRP